MLQNVHLLLSEVKVKYTGSDFYQQNLNLNICK